MSKPVLTPRQREVLVYVLLATIEPGAWYRASSSGERVTLASLHYRGILDRRARRGVEGDANAAYEYRVVDRIVELIKLAPKESVSNPGAESGRTQ